MSLEVTVRCEREGCDNEIDLVEGELYDLSLDLIKGPKYIPDDKFKVEALLCEEHTKEIRDIASELLDREAATVRGRQVVQPEEVERKKDQAIEILNDLHYAGALNGKAVESIKGALNSH